MKQIKPSFTTLASGEVVRHAPTGALIEVANSNFGRTSGFSFSPTSLLVDEAGRLYEETSTNREWGTLNERGIIPAWGWNDVPVEQLEELFNTHGYTMR